MVGDVLSSFHMFSHALRLSHHCSDMLLLVLKKFNARSRQTESPSCGAPIAPRIDAMHQNVYEKQSVLPLRLHAILHDLKATSPTINCSASHVSIILYHDRLKMCDSCHRE